MHYGVEEMFFVLSVPTRAHSGGEEQLSPGDVVYFPEGPDGLHRLLEPRPTSRLGCSPSRPSDFPTLSLTRSGLSHGWRPAIPNVRARGRRQWNHRSL